MTFESYSKELHRRRPRLGAAWVVLERVDSTHRLARRVVEEYARESDTPPPLNVVAWSQTGGRGRGDHRWLSPPGLGVYATLVRTIADPSSLQKLPLQVAVALCESLGRRLGDRCRLKWPNDLVVERSKVGGILIETVAQSGARTTALIGFGVNCSGDFAALGEPGATSLEREGAAPSLAELTLELVAAIDAELGVADAQETGAAGDLVARFARLSRHAIGDVLRCRLAEETVVGTFFGFDRHGFLRLEVAGVERRIAAGEVFEDG